MPFILIVALITLIYLPSLWVKFTIWRYSRDLDEIPGTGGELAEHLLKRFEISDVTVEMTTPNNNHYDPTARAVRLSENVFDAHSITAVAIAAHEVGHAIQFAREETSAKASLKYLPLASRIQKVGISLISLPFFFMLFSVPRIGVVAMGLVVMVMLCSAFIHLIILPQEWDASFNKALPILKDGNYIDDEHLPKVRQLLQAAALTYFAKALTDVFSFWRWGGILRGLR